MQQLVRNIANTKMNNLGHVFSTALQGSLLQFRGDILIQIVQHVCFAAFVRVTCRLCTQC